MSKKEKDRRIDRSNVLSEALDKLLVASAMRHEPLTAVVADTQGLLVASGARSDDHAERVAGVTSLLTWLRGTFSTHQVLNGLNRAVFEAPDGERLAVWAFEANGEDLFLGLLLREEPTDEMANNLIDGVRPDPDLVALRGQGLHLRASSPKVGKICHLTKMRGMLMEETALIFFLLLAGLLLAFVCTASDQ